MRIFGWMENKFNGKNGNKKINSTSHTTFQNESCKEEFSDWPHGLLAIGTFGNNVLGCAENPGMTSRNGMSKSRDPLPEPEETGLFQHDQAGPIHDDTESDTPDIVLNHGRNRGDSCPDEYNAGTSVVVCEEKELSVDSKSINKKSFSFLLKKAFVCGSGLTRLRDQVPETKFEKISRAMLHKKIYPQNPYQTKSIKRYLKNREHFSRSVSVSDSEDEDYIYEITYDGSKWVKTDSEYIVLEM